MSWGEVRAVSFDVGGTLVDTKRGSATAEIAQVLGLDAAAARELVGRQLKRQRMTPSEFARRLACHSGQPHAAPRLEATVLELRRRITRRSLYQDVRPTLRKLRRNGYTVVLLTDVLGPMAPHCDVGLSGLTDGVFRSCDTGYLKPEREAFAAVERATGFSADQLLHVGDTLDADVRGALDAGWHAVHLIRGGPLLNADTSPAPEQWEQAADLYDVLEVLGLRTQRTGHHDAWTKAKALEVDT